MMRLLSRFGLSALVIAGPSPASLRYVMSVSKNSFESKAVIPSARYVQVQAVDAHHDVIRSSSVVPMF